MFKYVVFSYILLIILLLFYVGQLISVKQTLEKRVAGIKTQIEQINQYEKQIFELENEAGF